MGRRGGLTKAFGELHRGPPLAIALDPGALETACGIRGLLGLTLAALAGLPFDVRVANAISQTVTAQRAVIEAGDIEKRLAALEASVRLA